MEVAHGSLHRSRVCCHPTHAHTHTHTTYTHAHVRIFCKRHTWRIVRLPGGCYNIPFCPNPRRVRLGSHTYMDPSAHSGRWRNWSGRRRPRTPLCGTVVNKTSAQKVDAACMGKKREQSKVVGSHLWDKQTVEMNLFVGPT